MWWILIKLAWRNLFRNIRRTFIAGTAIGIGLAALIFVDALKSIVLGSQKELIAQILAEGMSISKRRTNSPRRLSTDTRS